MCFILNLFNSCSFKSKSKPTKKSKTINLKSSSPIIQSKFESSNTTIHNHSIISIHSTTTTTNSRNSLNEKTSLNRSTLESHSKSNTSKTSSLETAEKLKEKLFTNKLVYSKLDSPEAEPTKNSSEQSEELRRFNRIIDYCNYCGYYCCECNIETNKNSNSYYTSCADLGDKNREFFISLNNSFPFKNQAIEDFQKTLNYQPELYSDCQAENTTNFVNILSNSSPNQLERMKGNNYRNNNVNININEPNNHLPNISSQSSLSLSSNATFRLATNPFNQNESVYNSYSNIDDVEMKKEENISQLNYQQQQQQQQPKQQHHHIPFEKPNLSFFSNRFNNDTEMTEVQNIFLTPKRPEFKTTSKLSNSRQPELKLETLKSKKQQFVFNSEMQLFAKPIEPEDRELSAILDNELNSSRSEINDDDSPNATQCRLGFDRSLQIGSESRNRSHRRSKHRNGKIIICKDQIYEFKESDLKDLGQIGYGEFGTVHKVLHTPSQTCMALKRIRPTVGSQGERKKVLKELDFVLECQDYTHVVKFYGVKLNNEPAENLICMELMDTSLEKFYKFIYEKKQEEIPEIILGKIVVATVSALNYLKESHKIIHRDVKPSNILINKQGDIKMCDFGISGKLVDSIAASRDAGCQLYMAPERIDPRSCAHGYDVRSDIWSLGITLYELATGRFPYPQWKTIFHQLNLVVDSDAPRLEAERLSKDFCNFVNTCLTKDERLRPKYKELLQHSLIKTHLNSTVDVAAYVSPYIVEM